MCHSAFHFVPFLCSVPAVSCLLPPVWWLWAPTLTAASPCTFLYIHTLFSLVIQIIYVTLNSILTIFSHPRCCTIEVSFQYNSTMMHNKPKHPLRTHVSHWKSLFSILDFPQFLTSIKTRKPISIYYFIIILRHDGITCHNADVSKSLYRLKHCSTRKKCNHQIFILFI